MRNPGIVLVIGILLFCCIATGAASAQTILRITNDTVDQQVTAVSDDRIIWQDNRTGDFDVYMYNVTSDEIIQIQINDSDQINPAIRGDLVVWQDNRSGSWDVVLFNLTTDEELRFTENESDQMNPAVTDGWVAWQGNQTGNWDIYLYNITDNETLQVTDNESDEADPVLSSYMLAWNDNSTGYYDIYVYPLQEEAPPPERPEPVVPSKIVTKRPFERLNANFRANVTEGVAPLAVAFSDRSGGRPDEWSWDFGDGNTSARENPVNVYSEPGNYTVSLEISRGRFSDTETKEDFITVREPVAANFTANQTSGTAPLAVQFNDTSTGGPDQWRWDFGDGSTSRAQDPVHVYDEPGNYTVSLRAIGEFNRDTEVKEDYIIVEAPVEPLLANFTANETAGMAPLAVRFNDTSTGEVTSGTWDFGDGNTSTERDPVHVYVEPGTYTVSLEVSNGTAADSITREDYITVEAPGEMLSANFTADPTAGTAPLEVQFTDTSTGEPESWEWDFGDGNTSTEQNPAYTYAEPGTYTVNLTVEGGGESNTITREDYITVEAPGEALSANFSADPTTGTAPLEVRFTDTSQGSPESWEWDFGDGNTSNEQNPTQVYAEPGTYTVNLTVERGEENDTITREDYITVEAPGEALSADFTSNVTAGMAPLAVQFNDTSAGGPESWEWDFGDGNTSIEQNATYIYPDPGTYTVNLTVERGEENDTITREDYITVQEPAEMLSANFTAEPTGGPAPLTVQFTDTSTGEPESWEWDFGDGNTSTEQNPAYTYAEPGTYTVNLTASSQEEQDIITQTDIITVEESGAPGMPPEAGFNAEPLNGTTPLEVRFTDTSTGEPESWEWDFGDGNTSTEQNPTYIYAETGNYTVTLTVSNQAGQDIETQADLITVEEQEELEEPLSANFTAEPNAGAAPLEVQFTDTSLGNPESWQWDFGDESTSNEQNPTHIYSRPGTYTITLIVEQGMSSSMDLRMVTVVPNQ